ncbi:MAG: helix-turn-helix domain-containing protein, partial [Planctomycetota bacterium]|nr:helix-turn-helix domain-containing protein [Planctomycetota bacterium]
MSRRCILSRGIEESELSSLGDKRKDARVERRVAALRLIAGGHLAKDVAPMVNVNERTICVWVKEYNRDGVASLRYDTKKGSLPHLSAENERELVQVIRRGPPAEMKIGVWRGWALRKWIR